jgi:small subunit ribosomal protein S13
MSSSVREIIRIGNTDLNGKKSTLYAIARIKGIGVSTGVAICRYLGIDPSQKLGSLNDEQLKKLEWAVNNVSSIVPRWFVNRAKDVESGKDMHLIGADLLLYVRRDIDLERKLRTWKGIRHNLGLKVRGQRTRSTGRLGGTVGVAKKKAVPGAGGSSGGK